ncbi:MAG: PAC2 family protein [Candidatus Marsarchaeota archaeon]|nr:PAC2 family protein [Candidatus Marsarchaeota archaeon]MCL5418622.1 PAC2 family protein [Candidatus Marsarchaeota archaeon]
MISINMIKKVDLSGSTLIEGFPGIGLVGPMTISYLIDKLGMEYVGYLDSSEFPPLVSIHKGEPVPPVRLYFSEKQKFTTIFAEFAMPLEIVYELAETVYKFVNTSGIKKIISISGIPQSDQSEATFAISSVDSLNAEIEKAGMKPIAEGVASGVNALLLMHAKLDGMADINILVPVVQDIIDPKYAEDAIDGLNKLLDLDIDTSELKKEAQEVEAKIQDMIKKHSESHKSYKKTLDASGPSMYA